MKENKKTVKIVVIVLAAAIVLFGAYKGGLYAYRYHKEKNAEFIDTRSSEAQVGSTYVKVNLNGNKNVLISSDEDITDKIETDITIEDTKVDTTAAIDAQIAAELENGYTLQNPCIIQNPYQNAPLTAVVLFNTNEETTVRVTAKGKDEANDVVTSVDTAVKSHTVPIVGLYADYNNEVLIEVLDSGNKVVDKATVNIQTDSLPEKMQDLVTVDEYTADSSMGLMLIGGLQTPYVYAFDAAGDIRWYLAQDYEYYGAYPLTNGHYLIESEDVMAATATMPHSSLFYEMDYLGRTYQEYYFPTGAHHDIKEMTDNGDFLVLTNGGEGYEQDTIMQISRKTGEVVKTLNLRNVFGDSDYVTSDDWAHLNTVSYDEEEDAIIISARNLHSAIKIDWSTDEIKWILCDSRFWEGTEYEKYVLKPEGDVSYQFQQHTSYQEKDIDADGDPDTITLVLFDNHNDKNRPVDYFDNNDYSYVKMYNINEKTGTVTQGNIYQATYARITSNYILKYDQKRMFAVCANLGTKTEDGAKSMIIEYDYDTCKALNQYSISHKFYRGYSIDIDLDSCLGSIDTTANNYKGETRGLIELHRPFIIAPDTILPETIASYSIEHGILKLHSTDHEYSQIIFNGKKHAYVFDISDIISYEISSYSYSLAIPLQQLQPDTYSITGMFEDQYFDTGKTITITK